VSFTESSFFPVPPDVLLAPMTLAHPQRWWRLAALTTVTSVLSGLIGHLISYVAPESVTPLLHMALLSFVLGSVIGRGARFVMVAALVRWGGAPIEHHIRRYVDGIGWATLGVLVVGCLAWSALR